MESRLKQASSAAAETRDSWLQAATLRDRGHRPLGSACHRVCPSCHPACPACHPVCPACAPHPQETRGSLLRAWQGLDAPLWRELGENVMRLWPAASPPAAGAGHVHVRAYVHMAASGPRLGVCMLPLSSVSVYCPLAQCRFGGGGSVAVADVHCTCTAALHVHGSMAALHASRG